jgi:hypothetical protein
MFSENSIIFAVEISIVVLLLFIERYTIVAAGQPGTDDGPKLKYKPSIGARLQTHMLQTNKILSIYRWNGTCMLVDAN